MSMCKTNSLNMIVEPPSTCRGCFSKEVYGKSFREKGQNGSDFGRQGVHVHG